MSESEESEQESVLSEFNVSEDENKDYEDKFLELDYDRLREKTSIGAEKFLIGIFKQIKAKLDPTSSRIQEIELTSRKQIDKSFESYKTLS